MPDRAEQREAVARAMWTLIAQLMDDPERSPCRNGPVEREDMGHGRLRWRPQRWDESDGAWRQEMLDMADAAIAAYEESMGPMVPVAEVERWLDHGLMDAPRTREVMLAAFRREFSPTERGSE